MRVIYAVLRVLSYDAALDQAKCWSLCARRFMPCAQKRLTKLDKLIPPSRMNERGRDLRYTD